jgi:hypothetical protein
MEDLDNAMASLNAWESRESGVPSQTAQAPAGRGRVLVGTVDGFFKKINVAAVKLTGGLKVGDLIEIGSEDEAIRQRVLSMQIDREDISEASEGDDVGIKLNHDVPVGSEVYRIV